jgi:hypothetical protein
MGEVLPLRSRFDKAKHFFLNDLRSRIHVSGQSFPHAQPAQALRSAAQPLRVRMGTSSGKNSFLPVNTHVRSLGTLVAYV